MVVTAFFFAEIPLWFAILGVVNCSISRGENGWGETIASTASVATLANFCFRVPLAPKHKIAFWDTPKPLYRKDGAALWQIANAPSSCDAR